MAETLSTLSHIAFIAAGTAFAAAVLLWFCFRIPEVVADLRGPASRKSAARVRKKREKAGEKWRRRGEEKDEEATVLLADEEATVLLTGDEEATVLLTDEEEE